MKTIIISKLLHQSQLLFQTSSDRFLTKYHKVKVENLDLVYSQDLCLQPLEYCMVIHLIFTLSHKKKNPRTNRG